MLEFVCQIWSLSVEVGFICNSCCFVIWSLSVEVGFICNSYCYILCVPTQFLALDSTVSHQFS